MGGIAGYFNYSRTLANYFYGNRYSGALWGIGAEESDKGCTYTPISVKILTRTLTPSYAILGQRYEAKLEASEVKGIRWDVVSGDLPEGITLGASGVLSGVGVSVDVYRFDIQVSVPGFTNIKDTASYMLAVANEAPSSGNGGSDGGGGCNSGFALAGLAMSAAVLLRTKKRGIFLALILCVSMLLSCAETFADDTDGLSEYLDELAVNFAREHNIPAYILQDGQIDIIRSYGSTLKAINEDGAVMYSLPDTSSQKILSLAHRTEVLASAEYTSRRFGKWYFVEREGVAEGWVLSKFIAGRDEIGVQLASQTQSGFRTAHATARKVNVRSTPSTRGKVLYQLHRVDNEASDEYLIVDAIPTTDRDYEDWYKVLYRYRSYGGDSEWSKSSGWIIGRYVRLGEVSDWDLAAIRQIH